MIAFTPHNVANIQASTEEASGSLSFVAEAAVLDTSPSPPLQGTPLKLLGDSFWRV